MTVVFNVLLLAGLPCLMLCAQKGEARPQFSEYPAGEIYRGGPGTVRSTEKLDERYLPMIRDEVRLGPNFAGRYRIVKVRTGDGPIGAFVVDVASGLVIRPPKEVAGKGIHIGDTSYLGRNDESVLSYATDSELLIVRRCISTNTLPRAIETSYFRWRNSKWTFLFRESLRPPPPPPVQ